MAEAAAEAIKLPARWAVGFSGNRATNYWPRLDYLRNYRSDWHDSLSLLSYLSRALSPSFNIILCLLLQFYAIFCGNFMLQSKWFLLSAVDIPSAVAGFNFSVHIELDIYINMYLYLYIHKTVFSLCAASCRNFCGIEFNLKRCNEKSKIKEWKKLLEFKLQ